MKIAYLMHYIGNDFEELSENIDQLLEQGDHVFVMINDEGLRDDIFIAYGSVPECHIAGMQGAALHGDLSLPAAPFCRCGRPWNRKRTPGCILTTSSI